MVNSEPEIEYLIGLYGPFEKSIRAYCLPVLTAFSINGHIYEPERVAFVGFQSPLSEFHMRFKLDPIYENADIFTLVFATGPSDTTGHFRYQVMEVDDIIAVEHCMFRGKVRPPQARFKLVDGFLVQASDGRRVCFSEAQNLYLEKNAPDSGKGSASYYLGANGRILIKKESGCRRG